MNYDFDSLLESEFIPTLEGYLNLFRVMYNSKIETTISSFLLYHKIRLPQCISCYFLCIASLFFIVITLSDSYTLADVFSTNMYVLTFLSHFSFYFVYFNLISINRSCK